MSKSISEFLSKQKEEKLDEFLPTAGERFGQEEPETRNGESITEILDHCAEEADEFYSSLASMTKRGVKLASAKQTNKFNPLFVGPTGSGKTSCIATWARDNGYDLVTLNMMGDALDFLGVKTINKDYELQIDDEGNTKKVARVSTVATQAFDPFLHGRKKILFLDEINKTNPQILQSLYDLISFHTVQNGDEVMYLPKLLFTVGAMNPSDYGGGREPLDPALKARMQIYFVSYDTASLKKYLLASLDNVIEDAEYNLKELAKQEVAKDDPEVIKWERIYKKAMGRKDIVNAIFADPAKFKWTDAASIANTDELDPVLVPRTLEQAIYNCDGSKVDFIKKVKIICGVEAASRLGNILANYQDKKHVANDIWGKDYSVKQQEAPSAEEEVAAEATEEERQETELADNMFTKLARIRGRM